MSASAYLKLKMTNIDALVLMCKRAELAITYRDENYRVVKDKERAHTAHIQTLDSASSWSTFNVSLDGRQDTAYDSDFRGRIFKKIFDRDMTAEEKKERPTKDGSSSTLADEMIAEWLDSQYEQASVITTAEELGQRWEEGTTQDGVPWVEVFVDESGEEEFAAEFG